MYRAVKLFSFPLKMVPVCKQLNYLSVVLVCDVLSAGTNTKKLKGGLLPPITVQSDILWSINRLLSCVCVLGQGL